jgi:hypothetical protein
MMNVFQEVLAKTKTALAAALTLGAASAALGGRLT